MRRFHGCFLQSGETERSELLRTHACMSRPVAPMRKAEEPCFIKDPLGRRLTY